MTPVRASDLATLRTLAHPLAALGLGWEDIAYVLARELPPSISRDDIRNLVIPKLKGKTHGHETNHIASPGQIR
jgi:hypothetical protein